MPVCVFQVVNLVRSGRHDLAPGADSNEIWAVIVCAEATPAATTRAAVAIITFVVSFFIVLPSFGFATALRYARVLCNWRATAPALVRH